ncbi:outer membrane protein 5, partial [Chlamydia pneumoniae B21]
MSKTPPKFLFYLGNFTACMFGMTPAVYSVQTNSLEKSALERDEEFRTSFPLLDSLSTLTGFSPITTFVGNRHNSPQDIVLSNYKSIDNILLLWTSAGGALSCNNFLLSNVEDHAFFSKNLAIGTGGAIACQGACTITKNKGPLIFFSNRGLNNASTGGETRGGAIACNGDFMISQNQGTFYFVNNSVNNWGGALSTNGHCRIQSNTGPLLFFNNTAPSAG